ncbi:MAG: ATP-grasp domain-containing protein [Acidobacteriota bacterium]
MRVEKALVLEKGQGKLDEEGAALVRALPRRGISVELFTEKRLARRQLPLARTTIVAGTIPVVESALRQLEVPVPEPDDYPGCLGAFLQRRVWRSTVGALLRELEEGTLRPVFAKPAGSLKRFTGRIFGGMDDLYALEGASRRLPIHCSEIVTFRSEWRAYVVHDRIVGIKCYAGDQNVAVDEVCVRDAVAALAGAGRARAGYGIDFGVLADGRTALVEMNDGYGLGSYALDPDLYADLLVARWEELMA